MAVEPRIIFLEFIVSVHPRRSSSSDCERLCHVRRECLRLFHRGEVAALCEALADGEADGRLQRVEESRIEDAIVFVAQ